MDTKRRLGKETAKFRHYRFAEEYVKDLDPYKAALRAGYGSEVMSDDAVLLIGKQLLKKPEVQECIAMVQDRITSRNEGMVDRIVDELAHIAFYDLRKAYKEDGSLKNMRDLDDGTAAAIQGVETIVVGEDISIKKIRANDKLKALEMLGKIMGAIRPDVKVNINTGSSNPNEAPERHTVIFVDNATKKSDFIETIEPIASVAEIVPEDEEAGANIQVRE